MKCFPRKHDTQWIMAALMFELMNFVSLNKSDNDENMNLRESIIRICEGVYVVCVYIHIYMYTSVYTLMYVYKYAHIHIHT